MTKREVKLMEEQIQALRPTKVVVCGKELHVFSELVFTMVDGKMCNSVTETSAKKCYICDATPKTINIRCRTETEDCAAAMDLDFLPCMPGSGFLNAFYTSLIDLTYKSGR